jgi:hypothetical protein
VNGATIEYIMDNIHVVVNRRLRFNNEGKKVRTGPFYVMVENTNNHKLILSIDETTELLSVLQKSVEDRNTLVDGFIVVLVDEETTKIFHGKFSIRIPNIELGGLEVILLDILKNLVK